MRYFDNYVNRPELDSGFLYWYDVKRLGQYGEPGYRGLHRDRDG